MNQLVLCFVCSILCHVSYGQTYTQTRTSTNLYMAKPSFWPNATWQKVQYDDNVYMTSIKSNLGTSYFTSFTAFNFSLPSNAVINNVSVTIRRFKTGRANVIDRQLSLLWPSPDGSYSEGNAPNLAKTTYWPAAEAAAIYTFSPSGIGTDGNPYNITVAKVNSPLFGFVCEFGFVRGGSASVMNIDQATMSVNYSLPTASNLRVEPLQESVRVSASERGTYNLYIRNVNGQLLQRAILKDPSNRTILLNNRCKGVCIITVEGVHTRKTIKMFVR
ncbi:MAG TPA: hypothetical protein VFP97_12225 [Chitinophagaceae bacterium]|nr:hypothetical protein [Chitinophagaceae bacterium]